MKISELKAYYKTLIEFSFKEQGQILSANSKHIVPIKKVLTINGWDQTCRYIFTEKENPSNTEVLKKFEKLLEENKIFISMKMKENSEEDRVEYTKEELDEADEIMRKRGLY